MSTPRSWCDQSGSLIITCRHISKSYFRVFTAMASVAVRDAIVKAATSLGYSKLKLEQDQAIASFVSDNDVFVTLPIGYGKSLCFVLCSTCGVPELPSKRRSPILLCAPHA